VTGHVVVVEGVALSAERGLARQIARAARGVEGAWRGEEAGGGGCGKCCCILR
jgi:hypothetical protein